MNIRSAPLTLALVVSLAANVLRPAPQISGDVREFLSHVEMVDLPIDDIGGTARAVRISGINIQIVNGMDSTPAKNGTGNLIVGYNENGWTKGSHGLLAGRNLRWDSYGGLVTGTGNSVIGGYSSALGGAGNGAVGHFSVVIGGTANSALGPGSVVGGGYSRTVTGEHDWAAGSLWEDE